MAISPQAYRNFEPEIYSGPQKDVAAGLPGYRGQKGGEEDVFDKGRGDDGGGDSGRRASGGGVQDGEDDGEVQQQEKGENDFDIDEEGRGGAPAIEDSDEDDGDEGLPAVEGLLGAPSAGKPGGNSCNPRDG